MRTTILIITLWFGAFTGAFAADHPIGSLEWSEVIAPFTQEPRNYVMAPLPILRILPEDVVSGSVHQANAGLSGFVVRWTYTKSGAKKVLAFRETYGGQKSLTQIGIYPSHPTVTKLGVPRFFRSDAENKHIWLVNPEDGIWVASQSESRDLIAALQLR
jgi:hypothetical protein